jgi:ribonuclease HI
MKLTIFTDGGGQPGDNVGGDAATAYVVEVEGEYIGSRSMQLVGTNNDAEYAGVLLAMQDLVAEKIVPLTEIEEITFISDSQLIVYTLNGTWRCKAQNLKVRRDEIRELLKPLTFPVRFTWKRREHNKAADRLVAVTMDQGAKTDFETPIPPDPRKKAKRAKKGINHGPEEIRSDVHVSRDAKRPDVSVGDCGSDEPWDGSAQGIPGDQIPFGDERPEVIYG